MASLQRARASYALRMRILFALCSLCLLPSMAMARDQIRVVGSSTVFPFVAAAAEQFGREDQFRTPIVESTGTGGGIKMFCDGVGLGTPDMANASREIKDSEIEQCAANGVHKVVELKLGYDGIVLANARESKTFNLTREELFLALARDVPNGDQLIANPHTRWKQINKTLPDVPISIYGPPPTSGTRDAFVELVMLESCKTFPQYRLKYSDDEAYKNQCSIMREDGVFIEAGEDDNIIVQKLSNNPDALGVFGYSFLEQNIAMVKANPIDGVMPSFEAIVGGDYHIARSLFVYLKGEHVGKVPGLAEFAQLLVSDASAGMEGYLIMKGLLPLPKAEHDEMKNRAATLN